MEVINQISKIGKPLSKAVVTIGNFDGVHIGHQALFHSVIEKSEAIKGTSVAITFEPHPMKILAPDSHIPLITLYEQKKELISRTGIDVLICIPFSRDFAAISAREFVQNLLVERIGMKAIVVGKDYTFGRKRDGNVDLLRQWAPELDYDVIIVDWIQFPNDLRQRISSTRIRDLVMDGQMEEAKKLLGRYYQIRGMVAAGRNRGASLLGFPTANIHLQDELCPKRGIYAVTVELADRLYKGVANIGYSPTFDDDVFTIEVHLLDFNENIYNHPIRVNFIQRLRDERKFENIEALAGQIRKDVEKARTILTHLI